MNEGKASKPTEKLFKKSGFILLLFNVQYYLDVLFLNLVGYHKSSDVNIIPSLRCPFRSTLIFTKVFAIFVTAVDFVIIYLPCTSFRERRERELHEAYKNARSQEEAEGILQQYIERFTISEAVLECLEMPKILERSHSTEPNTSSFLNDPNPMKYLRQQSLPPPKFTATVETTIAHTSVLDTSMSAGSGSPSKTVTPKAVPMLTPKPYSQPKNSQEVLKTFKVG